MNCYGNKKKELKLSKRYCIFASYNKEEKITPELIFYLKELNKIVDGVVFIMDNKLEHNEEEKLNGLVIYKKAERHNEYDFGSYKRGFFYLKENGFLDDTTELIFANDSCFGPLRPFKDFIKKWEKENKPDVYGHTINNIGIKYATCPHVDIFSPHIQSYFFLLTNKVFKQQFFIDFLASVKHYDEMTEVVINCEMGLSKLLVQNGFELKGYFWFKDLKENPLTAEKTAYKIIKEGFFIKKKALIELNYNKIKLLHTEKLFPYFLALCQYMPQKPETKPFFQKIFDINNENFSKIVTIFGLKLRLKRFNYKISNFSNGIFHVDKLQRKNGKIKGLEIVIYGKKNFIYIEKGTEFQNSKIEIFANHCLITIKSHAPVQGLSLKLTKGDFQNFSAKEGSNIKNLDITANKEGSIITIEDGNISNKTAEFIYTETEEHRPILTIKEKC